LGFMMMRKDEKRKDMKDVKKHDKRTRIIEKKIKRREREVEGGNIKKRKEKESEHVV